MKSILEKLYYGELSPCSQPTPATEKNRDAKNIVEKCREVLIEKYPECDEYLERYIDAIHKMTAYECLQDFEIGFRLGALMMNDVYIKE